MADLVAAGAATQAAAAGAAAEAPLDCAQEAVFVGSGEMPEDSVAVKGPDPGAPSLGEILSVYLQTGYQATNFGVACEETMAMLAWRLADHPAALELLRKTQEVPDDVAAVTRTRIFLGLTCGMLLSGVREAVQFIVRHAMVHVIVTPGGGLDADLIRTLCPDAVRVGGGGARQGNLRVAAAAARDAVLPVVAAALAAAAAEGAVTTPSRLARLLGTVLGGAAGGGRHESSVLYWCAKRDIPVYSPSIVDGLIGEAIFAFNRRRAADGLAPLRVDLVEDVRGMNTQATSAKHTGMIILGGGLVKHHICNANLMRNGSDHSVFVGTGQEFDGSDAGARPDEAVSWGKIRIDTRHVKVYADAALIFPALVAQTFVPFYRAHPELYPE